MLISVMGLIGSGKSTLAHNLAGRTNYIEFQEPVDTNPFLLKYYEDPVRWSYAMQVNLLFERYKMTQEAYFKSLHGDIAILDSTIYSDMAFALVQRWNHYFTREEYKSYTNMHKVIAMQSAQADITFWLEAPIEVSMQRINSRGRDCEANIPRKYLEDLREAYDIVLHTISGQTDVITLDATKSARDVYQSASDIISARVKAETQC